MMKVGRHEVPESLNQGPPVVRFVAEQQTEVQSEDQQAEDVSPHLV